MEKQIGDKIRVREWLKVKQHSRAHLLKLRPEDVGLYDIRHDDLLLVELVMIKRVAVREPEETEP